MAHSNTQGRGHPWGRDDCHAIITNVQLANYWSAATNADNPTFAWNVNFNNGKVNITYKTNTNHVWCGRGEHDAPAVFAGESPSAVSPLSAAQAADPQCHPV